MICCKNCGTPIGSVPQCPVCGAAQDIRPEEVENEPLAPDIPPVREELTRPIWETATPPFSPEEEQDPGGVKNKLVVVPSRSTGGVSYEMSGVVFGESAPIEPPLIVDGESGAFSGDSQNSDAAATQEAVAESGFREEIRRASSKLPRSTARRNLKPRNVKGATRQRVIAVASIIIGLFSIPYGIPLLIMGTISWRYIRNAIYAGTDNEETSNMQVATVLNAISFCLMIIMLTIGLILLIWFVTQLTQPGPS